MKLLDLTKALKKYQTGWVAINNKNNTVVAHAKDFNSITKKILNKKSVFIMPVTNEYFGFITTITNG
ncbi:MAG TPA: hypothetical protein VJB63_01705 [Patescibacteria group bacterium]|nr:hypothetical protein [Patescibacteria group bacterium]